MTAFRSAFNRAFTLTEALLSLALVALVTGLFASILHNLTRQARVQASQDELMSAALVALSQIEIEARNADPWINPSIHQTGTVSSLEFELPDYSQNVIRLPEIPSNLPSPMWESRQLFTRVRYQVNGRNLEREMGGNSLVLARFVAGLAVRRVQKKTLQVSISLELPNGRLEQLSSTFYLPLERAWTP